MRLTFRGHDDRYAIEQSLLAFFPDERPVYEGEKGRQPRGGDAPRGQDLRCRRHGADIRRQDSPGRSPRAHYRRFRRVRAGTPASACPEAVLLPRRTGCHRRDAQLGRADRHPPGQAGAEHAGGGHDPGQADRVLRDTTACLPPAADWRWRAPRPGCAKRDLRPEEISLYVGIPFCPTRCAYCSFVSASVEKSFSLMEPYLAALTEEITAAGRMVKEAGLRIKSFYMGGGTPTTLSARQMDALLTHLNRSFDLSDCVEYCIEVSRPDTIDREKLQVLLDHGADRISVNPQSLEPQVLAAIGRKHSPEDIEQAMALATSMGFPHVNMDLIAGLPADTPEGFRRTLDRCLTFGADNITVHTLSLKKGSRILLEGLPIPTAEDVAAMLDYADPALRARGFAPTISTGRSTCPAALKM